MSGLVVLLGGPYNFHWYTDHDWQATRTAEERMLPFEDRPAVMGRYVDTGQDYEHDVSVDHQQVGRIWRWRK